MKRLTRVSADHVHLLWKVPPRSQHVTLRSVSATFNAVFTEAPVTSVLVDIDATSAVAIAGAGAVIAVSLACR